MPRGDRGGRFLLAVDGVPHALTDSRTVIRSWASTSARGDPLVSWVMTRGARTRCLLVPLLLMDWFAGAIPLAADRDLVRPGPAAGEMLRKAPVQLAMELTSGTEVHEDAVTDPAGTDWAAGSPRPGRREGDGRTRPQLLAESYGVQWQAVTGDDDVVSGGVPFTLAAPALATPRVARPNIADIELAASARRGRRPSMSQIRDCLERTREVTNVRVGGRSLLQPSTETRALSSSLPSRAAASARLLTIGIPSSRRTSTGLRVSS